MRLTSDLTERIEGRLNALGLREFAARGFKIPAVENMGVLQDGYDCIDLSDNEIRRLGDFPRMERLQMLVLCGNNIDRVTDDLGTTLVGLTTLILTNNRITNLAEVDRIARISSLEALSLASNPVASNAHYRPYTIYRMPQLKYLDFRKVTKSEREAAVALFQSEAGMTLEEAVQAGAVFTDGGASGNGSGSSISANMTDEQKAIVRSAIQAANTQEEIESIDQMLKAGTFPFDALVNA